MCRRIYEPQQWQEEQNKANKRGRRIGGFCGLYRNAAFSISAAKIFADADTDESHSTLTMVRRDSGKVLIQLRVQGSHFVGSFHRVPVHK